MTRKWIINAAVVALAFGALWALAADAIRVIDGDTVEFGGTVFRLVGFDAPETVRAQCRPERELGDRATARLKEIVAAGGLKLEAVRCSCRPGTEGTKRCNYGRSCARLSAHGRDVGDILIEEGLARRYICGATSCPPRQGWC